MERAEAISSESRVQADSKRAGSVCVSCGSGERRIQGYGLCTRCYHRQWRQTEDRRKWNSRAYPDGCVVCGRTDSKHQGHGLCVACYSQQYARKNPERIRELAKGVAERNREARKAKSRERYRQMREDPELFRRYRERLFRQKYDGNGIIALESAEFRCSRCSYSRHPEVLEIHHVDHNRKNNALENLAVYCPTCHVEVHRGL